MSTVAPDSQTSAPNQKTDRALPLFPLPLVPFERYVLLDDRVDYPMDFYLRVEVMGGVQRALVEQALQAAVAPHPLLRAKLVAAGRQRWNWIPCDRPPGIDWETGPAESLSATRIDLEQDAGLRLYVRTEGARTWLWFQFHHACCDGLSATRVVNDFLLAYAGLSGGPKWDSPALDERRLKDRDCERWLRGWRRFFQELQMLLGIAAFALIRATPLARAGTITAVGEPGHQFHSFSREETAGLRAAAKSQNASLNDLLLRDLFLAINDWQSAHGSARNHVRLLVPMSLRNADDAGCPAANLVGITHLERNLDPRTEAGKLLRGLSAEMGHYKRWRLGLSTIRVLKLACLLPGELANLTSPTRCHGTAGLSNLMDPLADSQLPRDADSQLVAGDLTVTGLGFITPVRPLTFASFGAVTYAGKLTLGLRHALTAFSSADAERLLAMFVSRVRESLVISSRQ